MMKRATLRVKKIWKRPLIKLRPKMRFCQMICQENYNNYNKKKIYFNSVLKLRLNLNRLKTNLLKNSRVSLKIKSRPRNKMKN